MFTELGYELRTWLFHSCTSTLTIVASGDIPTETLDANELLIQAQNSEGIHHSLQMGVLAQDVLEYSFGNYVVNQEVMRDENGDLISDRYGIDAYNYASAILGGLQEEIKVRDEQYEELKKENEDLKARLDRLEQLILKGE